MNPFNFNNKFKYSYDNNNKIKNSYQVMKRLDCNYFLIIQNSYLSDLIQNYVMRGNYFIFNYLLMQVKLVLKDKRRRIRYYKMNISHLIKLAIKKVVTKM